MTIKKKMTGLLALTALLLFVSIFTLVFSASILSSVRALMGGEAFWSKAQKNAVFHLVLYGQTHDRSNYLTFLELLKVPRGDKVARLELRKASPDFETVKRGFSEGRMQAKDIPGVLRFVREFSELQYVRSAFEIWGRGDVLIDELEVLGQELDQSISHGADNKMIEENLKRIQNINGELTLLEDEFSLTLSEGARKLETFALISLSS